MSVWLLQTRALMECEIMLTLGWNISTGWIFLLHKRGFRTSSCVAGWMRLFATKCRCAVSPNMTAALLCRITMTCYWKSREIRPSQTRSSSSKRLSEASKTGALQTFSRCLSLSPLFNENTYIINLGSWNKTQKSNSTRARLNFKKQNSQDINFGQSKFNP